MRLNVNTLVLTGTAIVMATAPLMIARAVTQTPRQHSPNRPALEFDRENSTPPMSTAQLADSETDNAASTPEGSTATVGPTTSRAVRDTTGPRNTTPTARAEPITRATTIAPKVSTTTPATATTTPPSFSLSQSFIGVSIGRPIELDTTVANEIGRAHV